MAKEVKLPRIRCFDIGLLRPGGAGTRERVDRIRIAEGPVGLIVVDPGSVAAFFGCSYREHIAIGAQGNRPAKAVTTGPNVRVVRRGIRGLDVGLFGPSEAGAHTNT